MFVMLQNAFTLHKKVFNKVVGTILLRAHNVLELEAVHQALQHFLPYLRGKHVMVQSDNTSTIYQPLRKTKLAS